MGMTNDKEVKAQRDGFGLNAPQLSLPKGGGAIRGIGEKFSANPVTGTGSLTVPIYASPGRSGFGPQLSLSYDSGSGNGPFGFGWSLALPRITRKTDKGLPQYADAQESDTFILSGAEDLVPALAYDKNNKKWDGEVLPPRPLYGQQYTIHRYRPRVEGLFARIERWVNTQKPEDTFWRSISKDNITSWYGKTEASRVYDPSDHARIFNWLICESHDDKGNVIVYQYKPEDSAKVDLSQAGERNRSDTTRSAQRYIKYIFYGNRSPFLPDLTAVKSVAVPTDWCFQLVFDYGEHDPLVPVPADTGNPAWICRDDAFSSYRSTFEVRTYRLCQRVLMFHHFKDEADIGLDCLVRSTDFVYSQAPPPDPAQPFYSYMVSSRQTGYVRKPPKGYLPSSLPPIEFEYTETRIDETVREVDAESLQNLPYGMDGAKYRWVDLDGEGLSGILTEQAGRWFYKPNLSPVNQQTVDSRQITLPRFGPVQMVALEPSLAALNDGRQQLMDLSGDGKLDLVDFQDPYPGFFERTEDAGWEPFQAFGSLPVVDWRNPNLKFIDLTGDGFPDLLISEDNAFWWHASLSTEGFGPAQRVAQAFDEEKGPQLVFADGTESIFLADVSGDGLTDLVRIRNGEVCYWPNLGYGRFGAKVTMDQSPRFDHQDLFDGRRIHLADIDGTGTADIIYFAGREIHLYFNQSGNAWGAKRALTHFPAVETASVATPLDLLGNGTACLVWSSPLEGNARRPMRYIDLMGGQKPHLLTRVINNLGAETVVQYAPSTKFYVADKLAGTPWLTRLPFPVHVVEKVESYDYISRNRFVTRYAYHHGYFDGVEREFRGFGRVDQWDTEELATLSQSSNFPQAVNEDPVSSVPPIWTKTWFHTGAFFGESAVSKHFEEEYYSEGDSSDAIAGLTPAQLESVLLEDTVLPANILLPDGTNIPYDFSGAEMREACRALRGSILRQEIYALDNTDACDRPYSVSERNYTVEVFQPQGPNQFGAFFAQPRETLDFHYERKLFQVQNNVLVAPSTPGARTAADPRVTHALTLAVDPFGNVLRSVSVGYGRRYRDPALTAADQSKQSNLLATYSENSFTNPIVNLADSYRTPLPAESRTYELIQFQPNANQPDLTNLFRFDELQTDLTNTVDLPQNPVAGQTYRRLLEQTRTYYRPDDMGAAAGDPAALSPLKILEPLALPGNSYKLAFTPGLIPQIYQRGGAALLPNPPAVLASVAADGGGYVDLDKDGSYWIPAGRIYYTAAAATAAQEKTEALAHFFLPRRFEDPFGHSTSVDYGGPHFLLPIKTTDALPGALANVVAATQDYRVLQPRLMVDPNGTNSEVRYDALGMVVGTAIYKGALGDSFANFNPDLSQVEIDKFYDADDPHTPAAALLGSATTRVIYDVKRFLSSQAAAPLDPSKWEPVFAATLARETHVSDAAPELRIQITFSYSDGFSREIQKKIQAEPGPAVSGGPIVNPRWVGSGWTIFNNKGKPVRQYEPFFSQLPVKGHQFEFGVQTGVSPILCYDPADRVVVTIHPNHTYEKVVFDPWHQDSWDVNDTVQLTDPAKDPDIGSFFQLLPTGDYFPTWYTQNNSDTSQNQIAAAKALAHANTPTTAYFDTLGRAFLTVVDNAAAGKFSSRVELDIQGNQLEVRDAIVNAGDQGRVVMRYAYDLLKKRIYQSSLDAGEHWMLNDCDGKVIRTWDSRGHNFRNEYDFLRRPTGLFVLGTDNAKSDPHTLAGEVQFEKIIYGEAQPGPLNLRTRIVQHIDAAGVITNMGTNHVSHQDESFDFKGNLLRSARGFFADPEALPDFNALPPTPDVFTNATQYDAMSRPTVVTTPDGSVVRPAYNAANLLESVNVNLRGAAASTPFVTNIDYDAKGQRTRIVFGNAGTETNYVYDPLTFRLSSFTTMRPGAPANQQIVQALSYVYDPLGNITHIQDDADIQNVVFFRNRRVEPSSDYTYDAIYRLIQASGREQLGLDAANKPFPPVATSYNDVPRIGLTPLRGDGNAVGTYTETYQYDSVGNFKNFIHQGANPSDPGWTRTYTYGEASPFEAGKFSNRLSSTKIEGNQPFNEPYTYDAHGNMISMPQLQIMQWDFKDQLYMTQRQKVNDSDQDGKQHQGERTYYVYDSAGQRVRKVTKSGAGKKIKERFYLGMFELYREYDANGNTTLARETLHVMDEKKRVALVEIKTIDVGLPAGSLPNIATRYQFDNHLGTASLELDEFADVISYEEYYPFGSTSYQAGRTLAEVSLKRYRYTGKERDEETGFHYHGARYYATWLARWTGPDKKPLDGDSRSRYAGMAGNPIRVVDRDGNKNSLWDDAVEGSGTITSAIHEGSVAVGDRIVDEASEQAADLDRAGHPVLASITRWKGIVDATVTSTVLEVAGQTLAAGPNAVLALQRGGESIGTGAARIWTADDWMDATLGGLEILAGAGDGASAALTFLPAGRPSGPKLPEPGPVPGRVQTRINQAKGPTRFTPTRESGNPVSAGMDHVRSSHTGGRNTQSQFLVPPEKVLSKPAVVRAQPRPLPTGSGVSFVRQVDLPTAIGRTSRATGGRLTNAVRVQTDLAGNVITAYPVQGWKAEFNIQLSAIQTNTAKNAAHRVSPSNNGKNTTKQQ